MIRLRVSTIEAFRRAAETEWGDEAEVEATLRRGQWTEGPANWQMLAGTAWHRAMALESADAVDEVYSDAIMDWETFCHYGDYEFLSDDIQTAIAYCGPGLREITHSRPFALGELDVEIEGTADLVQGLSVSDHKTKFSPSDPGDYEESLQWRLYLLIHQARVFRYNLWEFKDPKDGFCALKDVCSFRFWPYPQMEQDCLYWIRRFLGWASDRDLIRYLVNDQRRAA